MRRRKLSSSVLLRVLFDVATGLHLSSSLLLFLFSSSISGIITMDSHLVSRGQDRNYTGFLTKTIIYTASFVVFLGGASTIACL